MYQEEKTIILENKDTVFYRINGSGNPIMLLHGFPENGSVWDEILTLLTPHFKAITPDLPASGKSLFSSKNMEMEHLSSAILKIIENEQIDSIVLVGHSMGGYAALNFAEHYPNRVKGLTLLHSTAYEDDEERIKLRLKTIQLLENGGKENFIKSMIPNLFATDFKNKNKDLIAICIERAMTMSASQMILFYKAMINRKNHCKLLSVAPFPIQLIIGKEDKLIPYTTLLTQSYLNNCTFITLMEKVGHLSIFENPKQLSKALCTFADFCQF